MNLWVSYGTLETVALWFQRALWVLVACLPGACHTFWTGPMFLSEGSDSAIKLLLLYGVIDLLILLAVVSVIFERPLK